MADTSGLSLGTARQVYFSAKIQLTEMCTFTSTFQSGLQIRPFCFRTSGNYLIWI